MAKKKAAKRRTSFSNQEPGFDSSKYKESLRGYLNWARVYMTPANERKWLKEYLGKKEFELISSATDFELYYPAVLARLKNLGVELAEIDENHLTDFLTTLKEKYKSSKPEEKEEKKAPKVSVQEKMDKMADVLTEDIDLTVDEFVETKKWNFDTKGWLAKNQISPPVAKRIASNLREIVKEPATVVLGKDTELEEGYSNFTKSQLKKLAKGLLETISILENHTTQRKARIRKSKTPAQIANKVKYNLRDDALGLVSIKPEKLVDAIEVWTYNTKTKKLSVYRDTGSRLSVKGTTIIGFDPSKSTMKNVRKPEEFFKSLNEAGTGKRAMTKAYGSLNAKELPVKPRLNKDTIILRVF